MMWNVLGRIPFLVQNPSLLPSTSCLPLYHEFYHTYLNLVRFSSILFYWIGNRKLKENVVRNMFFYEAVFTFSSFTKGECDSCLKIMFCSDTILQSGGTTSW